MIRLPTYTSARPHSDAQVMIQAPTYTISLPLLMIPPHSHATSPLHSDARVMIRPPDFKSQSHLNSEVTNRPPTYTACQPHFDAALEMVHLPTYTSSQPHSDAPAITQAPTYTISLPPQLTRMVQPSSYATSPPQSDARVMNQPPPTCIISGTHPYFCHGGSPESDSLGWFPVPSTSGMPSW